MDQKLSLELSGKPGVLAARDSLLVTALLLEVYRNDPTAKDRITTSINMLAMENLRLLQAAMAPAEREKLLSEGVSAAHTLLKELPQLQYRLPSGGQKRPTTP